MVVVKTEPNVGGNYLVLKIVYLDAFIYYFSFILHRTGQQLTNLGYLKSVCIPHSYGSTISLTEKSEDCLDNACEKVSFAETKEMKQLSMNGTVKLTYETTQIKFALLSIEMKNKFKIILNS